MTAPKITREEMREMAMQARVFTNEQVLQLCEQTRFDALQEAADYLDGYAGGHYMAQSCADALRELAAQNKGSGE